MNEKVHVYELERHLEFKEVYKEAPSFMDFFKAQSVPVEYESIGDDADFYVVPYLFNYNVPSANSTVIEKALESLPWFNKYPDRHILLLSCDGPVFPSSIIEKGVRVFTNAPRRFCFYEKPCPFFPDVPKDTLNISAATFDIGYQGCTASNPIRQRLMSKIESGSILSQYKKSICVIDRYFWTWVTRNPDKANEYRKSFFENIRGCKLVLCPRGRGTSSARLFESLSEGRIPIIFADIAPLPLEKYIDWENISIRIPEEDIDCTDQYVKKFLDSHDLATVSQKCKETWDEYLKANSYFFKSMCMELK